MQQAASTCPFIAHSSPKARLLAALCQKQTLLNQYVLTNVG